MDSPHISREDLDYRRGFRDGRMDALIPRDGAQAPVTASATYLTGYDAGRASVRDALHHAA